MQGSNKKAGQPLVSGTTVPGGTSLLTNSSHSSLNNIKSSNSQLKGPSPLSSKTLSNNNSASSQPNPQIPGSGMQSSNQHNNIKVRNDLMPGSAAALSANSKALPTKQHSNNAYQGNNGLQGTPGAKGSSSFMSSAQPKEDSPSTLDANSSSHQTKTKAMLKGNILFLPGIPKIYSGLYMKLLTNLSLIY